MERLPWRHMHPDLKLLYKYSSLVNNLRIMFFNNQDKSNSIPIEISKVRSVKTVGRRRDRTIPKAFEIFTDDHKTYMFKAKDGSNAEQWVQCLTLAMHKGKHTEDVTK